MKHFSFPLTVALTLLALSAPAEDVSAWFVPSAQKIMRDAKPGAGAQEWELAAAKNEVEACQVVFAADQPVQGVTVSLSPLVHTSGKGNLQPSLFKVGYVPIKPEKVPYPDALPPLTGPFDLTPGQAQPVWISVRVPKDAAPGAYRGSVKIQAGSWAKELTLSVKVWDFALPDTPACVTAFGNDLGPVAEWHGVKPDSPEAQALFRQYYEYVLDRRISSMTIPVDLMSKEAEAYLNDPRMTSYVIPYPGKTDDELKALVQRLIDGGWFAKGLFYVVDEPVNKGAYEALVVATDRLRKIEPRYRLVSPFYANPDFDDQLRAKDVMLGKVNIWCPHLLYLDTEPDIRAFLKGRMNAGDTVWWYVCNNPREPRNNLQIDQNAMAHRVLPWQQKREGIQGLLYWDTVYWEKKFTQDPWENMDTIGTGFYGDGALLYPGKKVGVDGPVGSIRLEVFRDGLEDYDYLALADQKLGREKSTEFVARVARNATDYERDPVPFEKLRRELGAALEQANTDTHRK
jgi:hypothetical protein